MLPPPHPPAVFAHHIVTLLGIFVGVFQDRSGPELTACLLITELSGPCMHLRQLLKKSALKKTRFAEANETVFVIIFLAARCALGPVIVYRTVLSPRTPFIVKFGGVGLLLVSLFWAFLMVRMGVLKAMGMKPPRAREGGKGEGAGAGVGAGVGAGREGMRRRGTVREVRA